eukprot:CAMPEP_0206163628 /NCGR_PEP_ID=MMETSP1474-20131121/11529_1 /ASSEMBLY_ACC=CAM_ASM_001110 /TAXON_ID=97495 /ORGANISM="Imantonia sp., Strain RCC918" /LENGTH=192 /DNA_ID=CAMNT_0053566173 /DNA_START=15 /DNA_END=589 /DNA_ORIENTATION=+
MPYHAVTGFVMLSAGLLAVREVRASPCVTKPLCTPEATVAVCFGGTPRTFKYDAVQRSLLENVLTGFGGANVTAFAYIKLEDSWGNALNDARFGVHVHSEEEISRLLRRLGVRRSRMVLQGADAELAGLQARRTVPRVPEHRFIRKQQRRNAQECQQLVDLQAAGVTALALAAVAASDRPGVLAPRPSNGLR